jgi:hypothetical protein
VLGDNNGNLIWLDDNIDVNILCFHLGLDNKMMQQMIRLALSSGCRITLVCLDFITDLIIWLDENIDVKFYI